MSLESRRLRGIQRLVENSLDWRLPEDDWEAVRVSVEAIRRALAADDAGAFDRAREDLERLRPGRRIVKARAEPTPIPEELRERQNELVHEIVIRLPASPDGGAANG